MNDLSKIVSQFDAECQVRSVEPFGSGHINDTYLVTCQSISRRYILQRINHLVFQNVEQLTNNILKITRHIQNRLETDGSRYPGFRVFRMIPVKNGRYYYKAADGTYWRMIEYIGNSRSFDRVASPALAFEAGHAFGTFQKLTSDVEPGSLFEVIPRFHDISLRLEQFRLSIRNNSASRTAATREEINFAESRAGEMHHILNLGAAGKLPVRVTHNDTKINNVLFNQEGCAFSVIDLDTVMPGFILYDFGDAIRTGASTGEEDEADLNKVQIDLALFEAYSRGYLKVAHSFLTIEETDNLAFSAKFMTYIIGLRFLTDHLNGDCYFKTGFPGHNLRRAQAQFKLLQSMEDNFREMQMIIASIHTTE